MRRFRAPGPMKVEKFTYLTFDYHLESIIDLMGLHISNYKFVLLHDDFHEHGDVIGNGNQIKYILNQGNNHFVPWHTFGNPSSSSTSNYN